MDSVLGRVAEAPPRPSLLHTAGALALMLGLPPLTYYLWLCLTDFGGALVVPTSKDVPAPTLTAVALYGSWLLLQALLQIWMPGQNHAGPPLADGSRLAYRMNGWLSFWLTLAALLGAAAMGWIAPTIAYDQFGPLLTTANIVAFAGSVYLYGHGRWARRGSSGGNPVSDYFLGTSLNPRPGGFDVKFFCESRPGLILWIAFNLSLAAKQYQLHGSVTTAMILVNAFQFLYVADYFFHEEAILTTWDIKHEKFGWMLCWGDLVWVPFTYTVQAYYLVTHPHALPLPATVGIVALNMLGYFLFRSANIQKHRFRKNPDGPVWGRRPAYIRTARGPLLLTSGWWGIARHLNYLGDLCMGLAWCLPCGFEHPLPYFYFGYFIILLVHRERRDDARCRQKYGADWEAYCRSVPWRIVPGVY